MEQPSSLYFRYTALVLLVLLIAGLLFSRALLSIITGAGILFLFIPAFRRDFIRVFKKPLLYAVAGISLFYTWLLLREPDIYTLQRFLFHLSSISILCLSGYLVAGTRWCIPVLLSLGVLSTLPSLYDMLLHEGLATLYEKGQVAYTLMRGDHQRFTIWISGCLALAWYYGLMEHKRPAVYFILYFSCFLLLLAVRTGWLFVLMISLAGGILFLLRQGKRKYVYWSLLVLLILPALFYTIPFARKKIQYMQWEWREQRAAEKLGGSDAVRRMVNETAAALIRENPAGLGAAGAAAKLEERIKTTYPDSRISYKWPFNQYLQWGLTAGWVMGIVPVLLLLFLLFRLYNTRNYLTAVWVLFIALTCLYESTPEMQYGLFLSVFFTGMIYLYERRLVSS